MRPIRDRWPISWCVCASTSIICPPAVRASAAQAKWIVIGAAVTLAVSVVVWLLLGLLSQARAELFARRLERLPRVGGPAAEFWRAVWMYRCRQKSIAVTMLMSWCGQVCMTLYFYCCVRVLWDADDPAQLIPSLAQHFLLVPIGLIIRAAPLFPGGVGIAELGYGFLYEKLGASVSSGVLGSLVNRVCDWVLSIFGFLIYRRLRIALPVEIDAEEPMPAELSESVTAGMRT